MPNDPRSLVKGLGVTFGEAMKTMFPDGLRKPCPRRRRARPRSQYPHEKEDAGAPGPRRHRPPRGELHRRACCAPASAPTGASTSRATRPGAAPPRGRQAPPVNALDRFDIDYSLCMYCGICVEVCPFDALFWSPEYEYSEPRIADLLHDKTRLGEWMETVPDFEPYEAGSEAKVKKVPR